MATAPRWRRVLGVIGLLVGLVAGLGGGIAAVVTLDRPVWQTLLLLQGFPILSAMVSWASGMFVGSIIDRRRIWRRGSQGSTSV